VNALRDALWRHPGYHARCRFAYAKRQAQPSGVTSRGHLSATTKGGQDPDVAALIRATLACRWAGALTAGEGGETTVEWLDLLRSAPSANHFSAGLWARGAARRTRELSLTTPTT